MPEHVAFTDTRSRYHCERLYCVANAMNYTASPAMWPSAATATPEAPATVEEAAALHSLVSGWPVALVMAQMAVETGWTWPPVPSSPHATPNNPFNVGQTQGLCAMGRNSRGMLLFTSLVDGILAAALVAQRLYNGGSNLAYAATVEGGRVRNLGPGGEPADDRVNVAGAFDWGVDVPAGTFTYLDVLARVARTAAAPALRVRGARNGGTGLEPLQAAAIALGASPWDPSHYLMPGAGYPGSGLWLSVLEPYVTVWRGSYDPMTRIPRYREPDIPAPVAEIKRRAAGKPPARPPSKKPHRPA